MSCVTHSLCMCAYNTILLHSKPALYLLACEEMMQAVPLGHTPVLPERRDDPPIVDRGARCYDSDDMHGGDHSWQ